MGDVPARDRIEAVKLAREAEELAGRAPWAGWLLRPLARLLRWMAADHRSDNDGY